MACHGGVEEWSKFVEIDSESPKNVLQSFGVGRRKDVGDVARKKVPGKKHNSDNCSIKIGLAHALRYFYYINQTVDTANRIT